MKNTPFSPAQFIDTLLRKENTLYQLVYFYGSSDSARRLTAALAQEAKERNPHALILHTNGNAFYQDMVSRIRRGMPTGIQAAYCGDLLILEDLEAIAGNETSEQHLYGIIDWYLENGKQLVVTGSAPVKDIIALAPRICAQIEGGISFRLE